MKIIIIIKCPTRSKQLNSIIRLYKRYRLCRFCTPFKRIVSKSNTLMMRFDSRFSKDEYPYSNQMFHLRASTGGAGTCMNNYIQ